MRPELWIHLCEVSVGVRHGGLDLLHDFHERVLVGCLRGFEDSLVDHLKDTKEKCCCLCVPVFSHRFSPIIGSATNTISYAAAQLPITRSEETVRDFGLDSYRKLKEKTASWTDRFSIPTGNCLKHR